MSIGVGVKKLSDISSNVAFYYSANDINLPVGSDVVSINSRVGSDACTFFGSNNYAKIQIDDLGFKYLTYDTTVNGTFYYSNSGKVYTPNNNETFVYVFDNSAHISYHVGFDSNPNFASISHGGGSYADYTVNSSRISFSPLDYTKTIVSIRFNSTKMEVFNRTKSANTILNPAIYNTFSSSRYKIFVNTAGAKNYAVLNIKEYLPDDKMNQLIKLIAFEHGVKI